MTVRNGSADWRGDVKNGSVTITVGDGVFRGPYSYDSRFGDHQGTNPEQLIAAAQAGCFTMALASILDNRRILARPGPHERARTPSQCQRIDLTRAPGDRNGGDCERHRRGTIRS